MSARGFPSKETVLRIKEQYPPGTRVELICMNDPYSKLKPGDQGTVSFVDDIGTVHQLGLRFFFGCSLWYRCDQKAVNVHNSRCVKLFKIQ